MRVSIIRQFYADFICVPSSVYNVQGEVFDSSGQWRNLSTPFDRIQLHVRCGYVIPWQHPDNTTVYRFIIHNRYYAPPLIGGALSYAFV